MARRALMLGAGVLLIGSLGVGPASATSYTDDYCIEVSTSGTSSTDSTSTDTTSTDLTSTDLTSTDLTSTDLTSTDLTSTDLTSTDLTSTDLTSTDLTSTDLTSTDLTSTDLTSTDLTSTDLTSPGSSEDAPDTGSVTSGSGGLSGIRGLRAADPGTSTDGSLPEIPSETSDGIVTTTGVSSGTSTGTSGHGNDPTYRYTVCHVNYSIGHYWYDYRPVGEVYATQVKRVPSGGVDTGN
ncbi:pentapeptide repeat-containing protein [Actinomycetospora sp. CA-053990]|uniref:pentapeptide repeat-containing protein n=1 Tax=Actinomycetospora sp. CA-053990 TaxID=3239891 RepID=UPI003D94A836